MVPNVKEGPLSSFQCEKLVKTSIIVSNKKCLNQYKEYEIGYQLESGFLRDMVICFDSALKTTLYSHFNLTSAIKGALSAPRPAEFTDPLGTFKSILIKMLYTPVQQMKLIYDANNIIVTPGTKGINMNKGHLTAKADFVYGHQQRATCLYVNVVPQWSGFNKGNWLEVEKAVRQYAHEKGLYLMVYTGTHGVTTQPNKYKKQAPLYLFSDSHQIPVPRFFWRVVYEPKSQQAVAFVGFNSVLDIPTPGDFLCLDISSQLANWKITWNSKEKAHGYVNCCDVSSLSSLVSNIPKLTVSGILDLKPSSIIY